MSGPALNPWIEARGLFERKQERTSEVLILRPAGDPDLPWNFPGDRLQGTESPEAALRRACRAQLGVEIVIGWGQPPFVYNFGTHQVTFRYYVAQTSGAALAPPAGLELRWVMSGQLRDYHFDPATQRVVEWILSDRDPNRS